MRIAVPVFRLSWAGLVALSLQAQAADETPVTSGDAVLAPVTVTAQKREEKLQDVPIAVTAFEKSQLKSRGIQNVADLSALAPGLQVNRSPSNDAISQISIRGNNEINPAITWDPAVGIYLDGVYLGKSQGTIFDIVDLYRVEVLRGPQGTLYGRNTIGGAINLVTRAPTGEWGGEVSTDVGNYGAWVRKAAVDLPAFGIAKMSFAVRSESRDGWVDPAAGAANGELNDRHNNGARFAVDLPFTSALNLALRYDRSAINQAATFAQLYRIEQTGAFDPAAPGAGLYFAMAPFASHDRQDTANIDAQSLQQVVVKGYSSTLSWNASPTNTLKAITAYRTLANDDSNDYDGTPLAIAETQRYTEFRQFSQELQWSGNRGPLKYVGGLYFYKDHGGTLNPQSFFFGGLGFDSRYGTRTTAKAVYGQLDYQLSDPLTLTAGLRYTTENKQIDRSLGVAFAPGAPYSPFIPDGTHGEKDFDATTPVLGVAYKITAEMNAYLRYAEGFKSGGFNGEYSNLAQTPQQNIDETLTAYRPEKQKSLELGLKTTQWDGRAQFNAAIFHNKFTDLQQSIFTANGAAASVIRNAGKGTVQGVELEAVVLPIKGTRLAANYAYLHPKFDRYLDDAGVNQADNRAFVHSPRNTFNLMADAKLLSTSLGVVKAVADYAWTSSYYTYPYQLARSGPSFDASQPVAGDTKVKAYGLFNARLALTQIPVGRGMTGELALFGRNLGDEKVAANFIDFGPGFGSITNAYFIDPRSYGLSAALRW